MRASATTFTPARIRSLVAATASFAAIAGCEREHRDFATAAPGGSAESIVRTSALHAGPPTPTYEARLYTENRWAVSEGQRLYAWYNCAGCHSPGGGGGMGPPHTDDFWLYGSSPENIYDSIVKGRPNGMPSYSGRISSSDLWKLVAYVRSLGGLTPFDTWSPRAEMMEEAVVDTRGTGPVIADSSRIPPEQQAPARP
jgi:cytochrome c oxidase cbb3-type subunit 3